MRIYNTGRVVLTQRYLAAYAVSLNMRDYPFDSQTLTWDIRSTLHNNSVVAFLPASSPSMLASSLLLQGISDSDWTFDKYRQDTYTITSGIFADYDLLSISITATRISTMSSTFLILPICLICSALCLEMYVNPSESSRIQTPMACITATMGFSFVVADMCPPVSYNTRLHLLIFQTYVFSIIALALNWVLWYIEAAKQRLSASNSGNKTLLYDSQELSRRLKSHNIDDEAVNNAKSSKKGTAVSEFASDKADQQVCGVTSSSITAPQANFSEGENQGNVTYIHNVRPLVETLVTKVSAEFEFGPGGYTQNPVHIEPSQIKPPESLARTKSQKTGAFKNEHGVFHDVRDLLDSPEVETFKLLDWGGGPIDMFGGMQMLTNENVSIWSR